MAKMLVTVEVAVPDILGALTLDQLCWVAEAIVNDPAAFAALVEHQLRTLSESGAYLSDKAEYLLMQINARRERKVAA